MSIDRIKNTQRKPARLPKPCKYCGTIGHTSFNCPKKPRKPLQTTKRMKKVGKIGKQLLDQAADFRKEHPGPQQCFYCLFIGIVELIDDYCVEHTLSKTRHPEYRFDKEKLVISCHGHNEEKGSKDIDEYLEILEKRKNGQGRN